MHDNNLTCQKHTGWLGVTLSEQIPNCQNLQTICQGELKLHFKQVFDFV